MRNKKGIIIAIEVLILALLITFIYISTNTPQNTENISKNNYVEEFSEILSDYNLDISEINVVKGTERVILRDGEYFNVTDKKENHILSLYKYDTEEKALKDYNRLSDDCTSYTYELNNGKTENTMIDYVSPMKKELKENVIVISRNFE